MSNKSFCCRGSLARHCLRAAFSPVRIETLYNVRKAGTSHEQTNLSSRRPKRWSGALAFVGDSGVVGKQCNRSLENDQAGRSDFQSNTEKPKSNPAEGESAASRKRVSASCTDGTDGRAGTEEYQGSDWIAGVTTASSDEFHPYVAGSHVHSLPREQE